jgi:hypothetical protein
VPADAVHEVAQVAGGVFPVERPGGLVVAADEGQQGSGELVEAGEVVGSDDFLLDDGEEDLVQPGCVQRRVDHDGVRVSAGEPGDGGLAAVIRAVIDDDEHAGRVLVLGPGHDLAGKVHERLDSGGPGGGGEHRAGPHVQAGEQREGAFALVFVLAAVSQVVAALDGGDIDDLACFAELRGRQRS